MLMQVDYYAVVLARMRRAACMTGLSGLASEHLVGLLQPAVRFRCTNKYRHWQDINKPIVGLYERISYQR